VRPLCLFVIGDAFLLGEPQSGALLYGFEQGCIQLGFLASGNQ
jgi:hypothetical protein